jgi:hypothetical protein
MPKLMNTKEYKRYVKKLSNNQLLEEYDIQSSPFSLALRSWDYDKLWIVGKELTDRLNNNSPDKKVSK